MIKINATNKDSYDELTEIKFTAFTSNLKNGDYIEFTGKAFIEINDEMTYREITDELRLKLRKYIESAI